MNERSIYRFLRFFLPVVLAVGLAGCVPSDINTVNQPIVP
jgi:hypothetical protein